MADHILEIQSLVCDKEQKLELRVLSTFRGATTPLSQEEIRIMRSESLAATADRGRPPMTLQTPHKSNINSLFAGTLQAPLLPLS